LHIKKLSKNQYIVHKVFYTLSWHILIH